MVQLREEQIKHRLGEVTKVVTDELMEQSGSYLPQGYPRRKLLDGFGWDLFTTPTVASRHSAEDLRKRITKAFKENDLNKIPFEFGLYTFDRFSGNTLQKSSSRFLQAQQDTAHNFYAGRAITAPNATGIGAIGVSEALFIVVPDVKTVVLRSLRWNISTLYGLGREQRKFDLNKKMLEIQRDQLNKNIEISLATYTSQLSALDQLMKLDAMILTKKAEISAVSAAQLANGKITSTVYLIQLNDEMAARLNLKIHEIKKINAWSNYNITMGLINF